MDIANEIRKLQTNEIGNIHNHKETFIRIRTDFGAWSGFFVRYLLFQSVVRIFGPDFGSNFGPLVPA